MFYPIKNVSKEIIFSENTIVSSWGAKIPAEMFLDDRSTKAFEMKKG